MKKSYIICLLCSSLVWANETEQIDRTGWHFGIGAMFLGGITNCDVPEDKCDVNDGSFFGVPMLNMIADYGVTPQFTLSLEHQGYVIAALVGIQGKYYFEDAKDTAFLVGGVEGVYAFGYGVDNSAAAKVGVGYAWNHHEIELDIHKNAETLFSFGWRYKF